MLKQIQHATAEIQTLTDAIEQFDEEFDDPADMPSEDWQEYIRLNSELNKTRYMIFPST
jgi:hypothetical protein